MVPRADIPSLPGKIFREHAAATTSLNVRPRGFGFETLRFTQRDTGAQNDRRWIYCEEWNSESHKKWLSVTNREEASTDDE